MIPTTITQLMGAQPAGARRRAAVCVPAYLIARHSNPSNVLVSGFWAGVEMGHTPTIKRPTRHLAPRTT